ncbi:MAG: ABC transporter permease [Oscillospiraceae bacterium]|nr:ABC transporter permease [Oscillospiraceae bacterium]
MRFGNLLKKELGELITVQAIVSMVFVLVLFIFMGQVMGGAMEEGFDTSTITVCNKDNSEFTETVLSNVQENTYTEINFVDIQGEDYAAELERLDIKNAVIIPEGYGESILTDNEPADIIFVSVVQTGGLSASMSSITATDAVETIQEQSTDEILLRTYGLSEEEIAKVKNPVNLIEFSAANGKTARISSSALQAMMMMQSMIAPFIIFFLVLLASQMIMTAISTEKIDKTLETLLSTPVSRLTVLMAKMAAAVISALLNALFMVVGFIFYMVGMMGGAMSELTELADGAASVTETLTTAQAMAELGFALSPVSYLLFGLQLFLTIAIALSVSLILGAMATDVKSVQTLVMPVMIAVMIPFFITMFMDMSEMSAAVKTIMFLIPFTHSYTALTNIMNGDMLMFWGGFVYQVVFFCVCMFLAVRMFTTDKLFTMSVSSSDKKGGGGLFRKKKTADNE